MVVLEHAGIRDRCDQQVEERVVSAIGELKFVLAIVLDYRYDKSTSVGV